MAAITSEGRARPYSMTCPSLRLLRPARSTRGSLKPRQNISRKPKSSALSFVKSPPTNHRSFDASAGFCVFPQAIAPPAREWNHIGPDVILAENLERLVVRRASLMNEIVNALLPGYQFRSLPNRRILSSANVNFSE